MTLTIFLPKLPPSKNIYLNGYIDKQNDSNITIYITKYSENDTLLHESHNKHSDNLIYGCVGYDSKEKLSVYQNVMYLEQNTANLINLKINNIEIINMKNSVIMLYDYYNFRNTQAICISNGDCFSELVKYLHNEHESSLVKDSTSNIIIPSYLHFSMLLQHIYNYWNLLVPIFKRGNKSRKQTSLILAILLDLLLGYFVLQLLSQDKATIANNLTEVLQNLINLLKSLLEWLMGEPVGLKLNKAFNKSLGKIFIYLVQLWQSFVELSTKRLDILLDIYCFIGYFGITFQIALISDWICLVTFHLYCFYGYVARMYNIQISGLIALLRLFVGRKYNPLRKVNDSCEYSQEELFVGTLAFTILLLLLPTTVLYYIVFTGFRLVSLVVQNVLGKTIYLVQISPLYVMWLWLTRSPKLKGNIVAEITNKSEKNDNSPLIVTIKLTNKPISELIQLYKPPVVIPMKVEWKNLLSNMLYGKKIE